MARFKNYLLVVIGFAVAGMVGAAFGTGTAQAVVSTLVSVVNPNTSPVQTSSVNVTDPGRIAYQSTVNNVGKCSGTSCFFSFPSVPAGHRVVVQHIGGTVNFTSTPGDSLAVYIASGGSPFISELVAPLPTSVLFRAFDQSVLFYVDSGDRATVQILTNGAAFGGDSLSQFVTLTGYELDCTVVACAPIATQ